MSLLHARLWPRVMVSLKIIDRDLGKRPPDCGPRSVLAKFPPVPVSPEQPDDAAALAGGQSQMVRVQPDVFLRFHALSHELPLPLSCPRLSRGGRFRVLWTKRRASLPARGRVCR
jgi:hypothetical protein